MTLEQIIRKKKRRQDIKQRHDCVTIKGVKNLSRADLDTIMLYCDTIKKYGTYEGILMPPRNGVREVLEKFNGELK